MVMDSTKRIHYGVENDEIYLVAVVVDAGTRRFGRKSSPKSSPENIIGNKQTKGKTVKR